MARDIEFLKSEISRLRTELVLESSPLKKLAIKKDIEETLQIINVMEGNGATSANGRESLRKIENNSISNEITNQVKNNHEWHNKALGKIAIAVIGIVLGAICLRLLYDYFGLHL